MQVPSLKFERKYWERGLTAIAGVDEAGRGAWAGPLVAGAVVFPVEHRPLKLVRDSKTLSARQREELYAIITAAALGWSVGIAEVAEIDALGVGNANRLAMYRAIAALATPPEHVFIDALKLPELTMPYEAVIDGDAKIYTVAAASIIAKVARDRVMLALEREHPRYGFGRHKGYGTALHQRMLSSLGPCAIHRTSFAPVRRVKVQG